jgi:hypothetical protein
MTGPISLQEPIDALFKQIDDGVRYANSDMQPYMEAQYINIAFLFVLNIVAIPEVCREWQRCNTVNQTWAEFRTEFARTQREQCII